MTRHGLVKHPSGSHNWSCRARGHRRSSLGGQADERGGVQRPWGDLDAAAKNLASTSKDEDLRAYVAEKRRIYAALTRQSSTYGLS